MSAATGVLVYNPNPQTVHFAGKFVNLSEISRTADLDPSYLSRIFRGERMPTVRKLKRISEALGMGIEQFITELENINKV